MEKLLTTVPYPVIGLPEVDRTWGIICTDHPTWEGGNVPTDRTRESAERFAEACMCAHPGHYVPGTRAEWRTVDPVTGECHLFAADGTNLSVKAGAPELPACPPETAVNAVIVAAMLGHPRSQRYPGMPWADMTPVVTRWEAGGDSVYCPRDVWTIEVQYSSRGYRAVYGITADNVPQCYAD